MARTIGFIGFGEAAECFVRALAPQNPGDLVVFCNGRHNHPPYSDAFRAKVSAAGARLVDRLDDLAAQADVVISAVVVATAEEVAAATSAVLRPGSVYVDISASTPARKARGAAAIESAGGLYVDANLMGSVAIYGAGVPLYCSGSGVDRFAAIFGPLGWNIEVAGPQAGAAAAVKMLRSVVTKGIEALVIEAMTAASRAGVRDEALNGICGPMDATRFSDFVTMCIRTDVLHAERRAEEMEAIAAGLAEMGIDPVMSRATTERLRRSAALGQRDVFAGRSDYNIDDVLDAYERAAGFEPVRAQ